MITVPFLYMKWHGGPNRDFLVYQPLLLNWDKQRYIETVVPIHSKQHENFHLHKHRQTSSVNSE